MIPALFARQASVRGRETLFLVKRSGVIDGATWRYGDTMWLTRAAAQALRLQGGFVGPEPIQD